MHIADSASFVRFPAIGRCWQWVSYLTHFRNVRSNVPGSIERRGILFRKCRVLQGAMEADSLPLCTLRRRLPGPHQCRFRLTPDEPGTRAERGRLRFRRRHLFCRLLRLRNTQQSDAATHRRAYLDQPNRNFVGRGRDGDGAGARRQKLLLTALSARRCRSRIFPWHYLLPHALVPRTRARPCNFDVHDRNADRGRDRGSVIGSAVVDARRMASLGLAMAISRRRAARGNPWYGGHTVPT